MAYANLEFRIKLFTSQWYLLTGDFGLLAFDDIGRVWMRGETSHQWHNGVGGGIYFVPFNMMIFSATVAFSNEDNMVNVSTGAKVNISF
jgi:outer membrane translocation and assembly module TamA